MVASISGAPIRAVEACAGPLSASASSTRGVSTERAQASGMTARHWASARLCQFGQGPVARAVRRPVTRRG